MDDAPAMGRIQSGSDIRSDAQHLIQWQGTLHQPVGQRLPFDLLHHQEEDPFLAADVVQRADVGMVQRGDALGFPLEAGAELLILGKTLGTNLDGHFPIQASIPGAPHLAHAAGTQRADDLVGAQPRAGSEAHRLLNSASQFSTTVIPGSTVESPTPWMARMRPPAGSGSNFLPGMRSSFEAFALYSSRGWPSVRAGCVATGTVMMTSPLRNSSSPVFLTHTGITPPSTDTCHLPPPFGKRVK